MQEDIYKRGIRQAHFVLASACTLTIIDAAVKWFVHIRLSPNRVVDFLSPFIAFTFHQNKGLLGNIPIPMPLLIGVSAVLIATLVATTLSLIDRGQPLKRAALLTLILGASGNFFDRVMNGYTTDYLLLFGRSIINLSDILIVLGVLLLLAQEQRQARTY